MIILVKPDHASNFLNMTSSDMRKSFAYCKPVCSGNCIGRCYLA